jgi:hypothetical protein
MRSDIKRRLEAIEDVLPDHIAKLEIVDYGILHPDYSGDPDWQEVHHDQACTVYRNKRTNEVRGSYHDRRSPDEMLAAGGQLEFL